MIQQTLLIKEIIIMKKNIKMMNIKTNKLILMINIMILISRLDKITSSLLLRMTRWRLSTMMIIKIKLSISQTMIMTHRTTIKIMKIDLDLAHTIIKTTWIITVQFQIWVTTIMRIDTIMIIRMNLTPNKKNLNK